MKRRCDPVRGDHRLLTPDSHTLSGVRLNPVIQGRSEGGASRSGHLSDSSNSESAVGLTRRRPPSASPTRRLRFEDETETEAETRYLERQRRRAGQRGAGVLVSKPDLNLYINGKAGAGLQGAGHVLDKQLRGRTVLFDQHDSCGTYSGGGVNLNLHLQPSVPENRGRSLYRHQVNLKTEPIRETYIGSITPGQTSRGRSGEPRLTYQAEHNGNQMTPRQTTPSTDLPVNPYAPNQLSSGTQPPCLTLPVSKRHSFSPPQPQKDSHNVRLNSTTAERNQIQKKNQKQNYNQNQKLNQQEQEGALKPSRERQSGGEPKERSPCVEEDSVKPSSSSGTTAACKPPRSSAGSTQLVEQPKEAEPPDAPLQENFIRRNESSRLSLRRLFSTVSLSRTRSASLDRLSLRPSPPAPDPTPPRTRKSPGLLRKTLSVQSLTVGSPFLQMKKSPSAQNLEQKKKKDRSADYRPAADQFLQRCLSLEDVGSPSSVRSVGRLLRVCPDGTFLLEVVRPASRTFGFMISRGNGRADSGVYVDDMVDRNTEKLFAGLLAIGDEILEVNGEKVACLSLDQVTQLLTQNPSTTIRVLRHWRLPPRGPQH
ncbi:uncharacterized protein V6R79_008654 [Siganus canaliculatus]